MQLTYPYEHQLICRFHSWNIAILRESFGVSVCYPFFLYGNPVVHDQRHGLACVLPVPHACVLSVSHWFHVERALSVSCLFTFYSW